MKTVVPRKGPLAGLDLTSEDDGRDWNKLAACRDLYLENGRPTKRRGMSRFYETPFRPGMLTQRATVERVHNRRLDTVPGPTDIYNITRSYPPLAHGFLRWHSTFQPTRAADMSWDFRLFTGKIDSSRTFYILHQADDEDEGGVTLQWQNIRAALAIYVDTTGKLRIKVDRSGSAVTWGAAHEIISVNPLSADTDYHIGLSYTASTRTLQLYINGVADNNVVMFTLGGELWHGETSRHTSYPNLIFLNHIQVRREESTDTNDTTGMAGHTTYNNVLQCGAEGMGIYEMRMWNVAKDYTSANYPQALRPLTAAEIGSSTLVGYWPMNDAGGLVANNSKSANRPIQLLPAPPAYVDDTGSVSGIALQFDQGCLLSRVWTDDDVLVDGAGAAIASLFSQASDVAHGLSEYTVAVRFKTPHSPKRRPSNAGSPGVGVIDEANRIFTIANTSVTGFFAGSGTAILRLQLYIPYNDGGIAGRLVANVDGTGLENTALTDDTWYTAWITRDKDGAIAIYLDASSIAYASNTIASYTASGTGVSLCFGGLGEYLASRATRQSSGAFRLATARMWSRLVGATERASIYNTALSDSARKDSSLVFNVEVDEVGGEQIASYCNYPTSLHLTQLYSSSHLGDIGVGIVPAKEWWDSWVNAVPPYWGDHTLGSSTTYAPAGGEGKVEGLTNYRGLFKSTSMLLTAAAGRLHFTTYFKVGYLDVNAYAVPIVPERSSSYRNWYRVSGYETTRLLGTANRTIAFSDRGYPSVWTGRALVPLGIDTPFALQLRDSQIQPLIAVPSGGSGSLTTARYYSYKFVYSDDEFGVVQVTGPTPAALTSGGATSLILGASAIDPNANDERPLRAHLNPRVTSITIYRSRGSLTAALAEAGPFLYHSTIPNKDASGIDGVGDISLGEALDDRFTTPPLARYGDVFAGYLVLANFGLAKDTWCPSQAGRPEVFDLSEAAPTEDGTGGVITGVKTAFDSCWLFKSGSLWRIVDGGDAGLQAGLFTASVGCIASESIVEFFSPSLGRRMLFFWSAIGPYLFDGNQPIYIGEPIKGRPSSVPYTLLGESAQRSIVAVDVAKLNQIWVFVKGDSNGRVYAYDYLNGVWVEHSGLRLTAVSRCDVPNLTTSTGVFQQSVWIAGTQRGFLYFLDKQNTDGPVGFSASAISFTGADVNIGASTTTLITMNAGVADWVNSTNGCADLVLTQITSTGVVSRAWVKSNTNTTLTLETALGSSPAAGDTFYIGAIAFLLEFPFDALETPETDKYAHYLITWADGLLNYRVAADWAALSGAPTAIADSDFKRVRTYINKLGEVFKLELSNFAPESSVVLSMHGWEMSPTKSTVRAE
jgi:hypothetical protein